MNTSIAQGWRRASVYDPATGSVVQFNLLNPAMCDYKGEPIRQEFNQGAYQSGYKSDFMCGGFSLNQASIDQLVTWKNNNTPVRAVVAGDKNVQWYESVEIAELLTDYKSKRSAGDNAFGVKLLHEGSVANIHNNINLLAYLGWRDAPPFDALADNYTLFGADADSFDNQTGTQMLSIDTPGGEMFTMVEFPIAGITLSLSVLYWSPFIGSPIVATRIEALSFVGSTLNSGNTNYSLSGIRSLSNINQPNTYRLKIVLVRSSSGIAEFGQYRFPALTTNGVLTPGTSFMNY